MIGSDEGALVEMIAKEGDIAKTMSDDHGKDKSSDIVVKYRD